MTRVSKSKSTVTWGRPEQAQYYAGIREALGRQNPIVLAEAATGVGKGRVMAQIALEHADEGVVVAAPTIQVLTSNLREFHAQAGPNAACAVAVALGRENFVSETRLHEWLEEGERPEAAEVVRAWIASGAGQTCEHTEPCHRAGNRLAWLVEDLAALVQDLPVRAVCLRRNDADEADAGAQAYARQRAHVSLNAQIVYCTHAAVIWDANLRRRGLIGLLPPYGLLVLDEAHLFESAMDLAFAQGLAVRSIAWRIGSGWDGALSEKRAAKGRKAIDALVKALIDDPRYAAVRKTNGIPLDRAGVESMREWLVSLRDVLRAVRKHLAGVTNRSELDEGLKLVEDLLEGKLDGHLQLSPVRRFPSIAAGPVTFKFFTTPLWAATPKVLLVSATLCLVNDMGQYSDTLIRMKLELPAERVVLLPPVIPDWLYAPTLMIPAPAARDALMPPQEHTAADAATFEAALDAWHGEVARWLRWIHANAMGGVLVLLPGYEAIRGIAGQLEELGESLVAQSAGGIHAARSKFVARFEAGDKPLWLAAGPAWTGVDLNGAHLLKERPEPSRDWLLTDLVVPRVPFAAPATNAGRAVAHQRRQSPREEAAFRVRQGFGRLMRRPGLLRRQIWLLDGRVWNAPKPFFYTPIRELMRPYAQKPVVLPEGEEVG